jgi:hypothetical protein
MRHEGLIVGFNTSRRVAGLLFPPLSNELSDFWRSTHLFLAGG